MCVSRRKTHALPPGAPARREFCLADGFPSGGSYAEGDLASPAVASGDAPDGKGGRRMIEEGATKNRRVSSLIIVERMSRLGGGGGQNGPASKSEQTK